MSGINVPESGFAAVNSQRNGGPYAIRKVIIGPNGQPMTVIVDARTGQQLSSMNGFTLMENNYVNPNSLQTNPAEPPKETTAQETIQQDIKPPEPQKFPTRGEQPTGIINGDNFPRSETNNYGYIDKPGIVKAASFAPGALGLAGKAINLGINTNNAVATNAARDAMDVPQNTGFGFAKDVVKDNKGQVGSYNINNRTYSVGTEAISPTGVTNLTPNEARVRGKTLPGGITPATQEQVKTQNAKASKNREGPVQKMLADARNFFSSLFDDTPSGGSSKSTQTGGFINTKDTHRSDQEGNISGEGGIDSYGGPDGGDPASDDRL